MIHWLTILMGIWVQPCQQGVVREEHFSLELVALVEKNFQDPNCQIPQLESRSEGRYSIGNHLPLNPPGREMDFEFTRVEMRGRSAAIIEWMRTNNLCGRSDWQLDEFLEVTGRSCHFALGTIQVPFAGEKRFGIFRVEVDQLFFGKLSESSNGKSRESRPTEWDARPFLRKLTEPSNISYDFY